MTSASLCSMSRRDVSARLLNGAQVLPATLKRKALLSRDIHCATFITASTRRQPLHRAYIFQKAPPVIGLGLDRPIAPFSHEFHLKCPSQVPAIPLFPGFSQAPRANSSALHKSISPH